MKDSYGELTTTGGGSRVVANPLSLILSIELVDGTSRHHIDDLHLNDITFGRVQTAAHVKQQQNNDWVHVVNVNKGIANFSEVVPQPAREFPFELETFEKEAVYHLDQLD